MVPLVAAAVVFLLAAAVNVGAQNSVTAQDSMAGFQPTLAFVIAMLSIMFSITFVLLLYAKFCHRPVQLRRRVNRFHDGFLRSWRRSSGLDKSVVDSLPFFRFEALKGAKEGLECCVCLARFEDVEVLRLLPKCKHAFHIDCIDSWLDKHSTCPLCRQRVTVDDLLLSNSSGSLRFPSERSDLYVQREESRDWSNSRVGIGDRQEKTPFRLAVDPGGDGGGGENLHNFNHKIVEAEASGKGRWSSMSSPDLILLSSEMTTDVSRTRIPAKSDNTSDTVINVKEEIEWKRALDRKFTEITGTHHAPPLPTPGDSSSLSLRSFSDISVHPRFTETSGRRSYGGAGRVLRPQIDIKPEPLPRNSTAEEPNRRVVNV